MSSDRTVNYDALAARIGEELGVSSWYQVDQRMIDRFAELSGDCGFIHVNPAAAAKTRFGGTIAHGLLTLSLTALMASEVLPVISDRAYLLNYGYDKVRMLSPVPTNSKLRGRFRLVDALARSDKQRLMRYSITVELFGAERLALVAEWLSLVVLK